MQTVETNVTRSGELEQLLQETHEVLVQNFEQELKEGKRKEFKVVDLWKMEKGLKSAHINSRNLN